MKTSLKRQFVLAAVVASAVCSGGCSRSVLVCVRNDFPFPIFVHETTEWRNIPRTRDSGRIAPQDISLAAEISRGETVHLQVVDSKEQLLRQVTVTAAAVREAYQGDTEIMAEVGPENTNITVLKSSLANPSNNWQTFSVVSAALIGLLIAFGFWQRRM